MYTNYFPDTNVILNYLPDFPSEKDIINKLMEKTGKNKALNGFLVKSVKHEFEAITRIDRLNKTIKDLINIVEDTTKSNSIPIFFKELEKHKENEYYPSEQIVIDETIFRTKEFVSFDQIELKKSIYEIFSDFKLRKQILLKKLEDCEKNKTPQKIDIDTDQLSKTLEHCFPIKKEKDRKDNEHIINAVQYCKLLGMNAVFITSDNFRRTPKSFNKYAKVASKKINEITEIKLAISKTEEYISNK